MPVVRWSAVFIDCPWLVDSCRFGWDALRSYQVTGTGVDEPVVVPFPSSPSSLLPQHSTVPLTMAQVLMSVAAIAVAPLTLDTVTGTDEFTSVPLPSSPSKFPPQHATVPLVMRAQQWDKPQLTSVTPVKPETAPGVS